MSKFVLCNNISFYEWYAIVSACSYYVNVFSQAARCALIVPGQAYLQRTDGMILTIEPGRVGMTNHLTKKLTKRVTSAA